MATAVSNKEQAPLTNKERNLILHAKSEHMPKPCSSQLKMQK